MTKKTEIAVILAGGKSTRFGQPKALVDVDGKPLLAYLIEQIKTAGIGKIYISTDDSSIFSQFGLECIPDEYKDCGPLAGIHSALKFTGNDSILFLSCDLPSITSSEITKLLDAASTSRSDFIYAVTESREHPLFAIIRKKLIDDLVKSIEKKQLSVLDFIHGINNEPVFFDDESRFLNLNTPDDFKPCDDNVSPDLEMMVDAPIDRFQKGKGWSELDDPVIREAFIRIWLNDDEIAVIHALKKYPEDLTIGFLYTECLINDLSAIESVEYNDKLDTVTVVTSEKPPEFHSSLVRTIAPGCGQVHFSIRPTYSGFFDTVDSGFRLKPDMILSLMNSLLKSSQIFRDTGGVHTAALSDGERIVHVVDDIGRHNCVDKIIGHELRTPSIPQDRRMILSSGRVSTDIVTKAIRAKIPFLISHSAPSEGAIQLSKKYGITLIGFARGTRFNVYTHADRIQK